MLGLQSSLSLSPLARQSLMECQSALSHSRKSQTPTNYLAGRKSWSKTTRVQRIKFCKLPGAASARHPGLMWCKLQKERNTIASSEISAMTISELVGSTVTAPHRHEPCELGRHLRRYGQFELRSP